MRRRLVGRRAPAGCEVGTAAPDQAADRPPCYRWAKYAVLRGTIRRETSVRSSCVEKNTLTIEFLLWSTGYGCISTGRSNMGI